MAPKGFPAIEGKVLPMKDMMGMVFDRLRVMSFSGKNEKGGAVWLCRCDCGAEKTIYGGHLRAGYARSCGCLRDEKAKQQMTKHGGCGSSEHAIWHGMIGRCEWDIINFKRYGGRGIKVCDRWRSSFDNFLADMGPRPVGKSLDRINNDGDYEPANCRWATPREQARNRHNSVTITVNGETMLMIEAAERFGVNYQTIRWRLRAGWSPEKSVDGKVRERKR